MMFNVPSPFLNLNHRYMAILASDADSVVYSALEFNLVRLVSSQPEQMYLRRLDSSLLVNQFSSIQV